MTDFHSVNGKVAVVTGAANGIGEAIARIYAENGMQVVCADWDSVKGEQVVQSIRAAGGEAFFRHTDCSKADGIRALVDFAVAHYGKLDGIVSNAGVGQGGTPAHELSLEEFDKIVSLNLKSVFAGMKYGTQAIFRTGSAGGFLINIASVAGLVPQRGQALYTATKSAVVGMTKTAALDYASYNITVNAICPGYTRTTMFEDIPEQAMQFFLQDAPSGKLGTPEECAWLALFLASDMARYISGAAIPVDGALSAGAKNLVAWRHPELRQGGECALSSQSTVAVIMEHPKGAAIVNKYLPGFGANEQAKAAYGMSIQSLCELPMLGISRENATALFEELDALGA